MSSSIVLSTPALLTSPESLAFPLDATELKLLRTAAKLVTDGYPSHSLLDLWNSAIHNLRRRVEAYGVDLWSSVVKDESGRKKYNPQGGTLAERWEGVDDLVLVHGARRLDLLTGKAGKALEMINWVRNHASPAHETDDEASVHDVIAIALMLQENLFSKSLPDPGHSVSALFDPVKSGPLVGDAEALLKDQVRALRPQDLRTCFGFLLDLIFIGVEPGATNARLLFFTAWELVPDELKKVPGVRYHTCVVDPAADDSPDKGGKRRLLELLVGIGGVAYIPDASRAVLYRRAAAALAKAKNTSYGWNDERVAAAQLAQLGPHVPQIAFEEVYQEIVAVWCGNYWDHSGADSALASFVSSLDSSRSVQLAELVRTNPRARSEFVHAKPCKRAKVLLFQLLEKVTFEVHKAAIEAAIASL